MSVLRRLFSGSYRRARIAEARGLYREAAAFYAASGAAREAAGALLEAAERSERFEERALAYQDAQRWCPREDPLSAELTRRFGALVLGQAQSAGLSTDAERRRLREAAKGLVAVGAHLEAAAAWELLGAWDEVAASLEGAGEVERLERLLIEQGSEAERRRALSACLEAYGEAMAVGARAEALEALTRARRLAPADEGVLSLTRQLERRRLKGDSLRLRVAPGRTVVLVCADALLLGREGPLSLRGASVSRQHARVCPAPGGLLRLEDLGSSNGTLLDGFPIAGALELEPRVIGLGEDVAVSLGRAADLLSARVERGVDRGLEAYASLGPLAPEGLRPAIAFFHGWPTALASQAEPALLDGRDCHAPIELLVGDVVEVGALRFEVLS